MSGISPFRELLKGPSDNFLDGDQLSPPREIMKRSSETALDIIASTASHVFKKTKIKDPFQECMDMIDVFADDGDEVVAVFYEICGEMLGERMGVLKTEHLKEKFTCDQIKMINSVLKWYHLLRLGKLPEITSPSKGLTGIKKNLGIDTLAEILIPFPPKKGSKQRLNFSTLKDLIKPYLEMEDPPKDPYFNFLFSLADQIGALVATDEILSEFRNAFYISNTTFTDSYREYFNTMDLSFRLRFMIFIKVVSSWMELESIIIAVELDGMKVDSQLQPLINWINDCIERPEMKGLKVAPSKTELFSYAGAAAAFPKFAKMNLPGLPNWMPNGGNTCYISATLWPLYLLFDSEIHTWIEKYRPLGEKEAIELDKPGELHLARIAFANLYRKICAEKIEGIEIKDVNNFRKAMQAAFPDQFPPMTTSQEDAYEFLVCVIHELLELNSKSSSSKYAIRHTFSRVSDEPIDEENYDVGAALSPAYSTQPSFILDVRLDEEAKRLTSLRELITTSRETEKVERNAYKKGEFTGPKYISFPTSHRELCVVESRQSAPQYFVGRLTRFSFDYAQGIQKKRFDPVSPNASLEFHIRGKEMETGEIVHYDLAAITVHNGSTTHSGHYYVYFRKNVGGEWKFLKFDDIGGPAICQDDKKVMIDLSTNGYIFYYKKRELGAIAPPPLPLEESLQLQNCLPKALPIPETLPPAEGLKVFMPTVGIHFHQGTSGIITAALKEPLVHQPIALEVSPLLKEEVGLSDTTRTAFKSPSQGNEAEAKIWVVKNLPKEFYIPEKDFYFQDFTKLVFYYTGFTPSIEIDGKGLDLLSSSLKRPIYLLDPINDRDLTLLPKFPVPGDGFRHGEDYMGDPLYLYRQRNGSFVSIAKV